MPRDADDLLLDVLEAPDEIRQSQIDPQVLLFYKGRSNMAEVLMKDRSGRVIGFEKLNFSVSDSDSVHVALETAPA